MRQVKYILFKQKEPKLKVTLNARKIHRRFRLSTATRVLVTVAVYTTYIQIAQM